MVASALALNTIAAPQDGDLAYRTDTDKLYVREAGAWVEVSGSSDMLTALNELDRWAIAASEIEPGKLVYQIDTKILWEYTGSAAVTAAAIATPGNWTQITSSSLTDKVIEVQDATGLPSPTAARADQSSPLYLIRYDQYGQPLNQLVWWDDNTPAPTLAVPNPPASGQWIIPTSTTFLKTTQSAADQAGSLKVGDIQGTIQPDHAELKMFDGANWQMLFSEDEIRSWIAAGSLFQGTVMEAPVVGGAVDLVDLPAPTAAYKGYYWTWLGPDGYDVTDGSLPGDPAQQPGFVQINVIPDPLPAAWPLVAGASLRVTLDTGGQPIGVDRPVTAEIEVMTPSGPDRHRVTVSGLASDTDADIAAKIVAAWPAGKLSLDLRVENGNEIVATPQDPTTQIVRMHDFPPGATPAIGVDLVGERLRIGDWLQVVPDSANPGQYRWAHVPADLLSKLRGDRLYSIQPWADGAWEVNSVVNLDGRLWRARRNIGPGDPAPELPGIPTTIRGIPPIADYPQTDAAVEAWLAQPVTPQRRGEFIVLDAGVTAGGP